MSIFNQPKRLSDDNDLRCQGCGQWLNERDLRCGLSLYCVDCCPEPSYMHDDPVDASGDDEYER